MRIRGWGRDLNRVRTERVVDPFNPLDVVMSRKVERDGRIWSLICRVTANTGEQLTLVGSVEDFERVAILFQAIVDASRSRKR